MTEKTEVRCPVGPRALLAKVIPGEKKYTDAGTLELSCRDCTKMMRKNDSSIKRVLHEYNILGELLVTKVDRY